MNAQFLPLMAALTLGVALFTMVWAGLHWTWIATVLGGVVGVLATWRMWQFGLQQQTQPHPAAMERLAMKLAWRRGGWLQPSDLDSLGLTAEQARQLLDQLAQRGMCAPEGEGYRFYPAR